MTIDSRLQPTRATWEPRLGRNYEAIGKGNPLKSKLIKQVQSSRNSRIYRMPRGPVKSHSPFCHLTDVKNNSRKLTHFPILSRMKSHFPTSSYKSPAQPLDCALSSTFSHGTPRGLIKSTLPWRSFRISTFQFPFWTLLPPLPFFQP